ncbi:MULTISPECIES: hypothetical protein [unclassified Nocardia]|uniref:hypothetical protein n=1 Tax=unclassified Nocardia TaxID=2637762 RepID=UPI001CE424E9|nr:MULTISPECIES: hypothetical protein [unclassified Nocardia]
MRGGRILLCEWGSRLDVEVAVEMRIAADTVVVIATAPTRVALPVFGRVEVLCEYLTAQGIAAYAVHARSLRAGAVWTTLRGRALAGVVPAADPDTRISRHRPRLPRLAARLAPRLLVAGFAVVAALLCTAPTSVGVPTGQPGLNHEPHSPGQAGVTAPPRPASPTGLTGNNERPDTGRVVSEQSTELPQTMTSWSVQVVAEPGSPASPDVEGDTLRIGAIGTPRPEWVPAPLATRERAWNTFLTRQAATAVKQAGLTDPGTGAEVQAVLGSSGTDPVEQPPELTWMQEAVTDPQAVASLAAEVAEPVAAAVPQATDTIEALLAQLPSDRR